MAAWNVLPASLLEELKDKKNRLIRETSTLERDVGATATLNNWMTNLPDKFDCFLPVSTTVTGDATDLSPTDSYVYSSVRGQDETTQSWNHPRLFLPSLRAASELVDAVARFQIKVYSIVVENELASVIVSNSREYGGRAPRESRIRKAVGNTRRVSKALGQLETLKRGCVDAFYRASAAERSPVNACFSAWGAGLVDSVQTVIRRMVYSYGGSLSKYATEGMHLKGTNPTSRTAFLKSVSDKLANGVKLDTAKTVFDRILKKCLNEFLEKTTESSDEVTSPYRNVLRQARRTPGDEPSSSIGMLTPRESIHEVISGDRKHRMSKTDYESDEKVAGVARIVQSKRRTSGTGRAPAARVFGGREWSMHITQLFAQSFLESVASLLAQSFKIDDPFSTDGFDAIGQILVKEQPSHTTRRVKMNADGVVEAHLLGVGNFYLNFVVSAPDDIVEGRRVSVNTPVLAVATKVSDTESQVHLTDRLLVENSQVSTVLNNGDGKTQLVGCNAVLREKSAAGDQQHAPVLESLAMDWYHTVSSLGAAGRLGEAVAAGVMSGLGAKGVKLVNEKGEEIERPRPRAASVRRALRQSAHLLTLMGQSLSAWGHSGHNDSLASFWSQAAAVRSLADQTAMAERIASNPNVAENAEAVMRHKLSSGLASADFSFGTSEHGAGLSADNSVYLRELTLLPAAIRQILNVKGLHNVLGRFRLPLARGGTKITLKNMRGLDSLMSALGNMTLQSVANVTERDSLVVEPTRMRALARLANYLRLHRRSASVDQAAWKHNIIIPTCPLKGAVTFPAGLETLGRPNNIILPTAILSRLVSDKIKLDSLCEVCLGSQSRLNHAIADLVGAISGRNGNLSFYSSLTPDNFISLVSYLWLTTAIVSLTDTHAVAVIDAFKPGLGASIYRDYMAVRQLVDEYYNAQIQYTAAGIIRRHGEVRRAKFAAQPLGASELETVLGNITTNLAAFTKNRETAESGDDADKTVKSLEGTESVKKMEVSIEIEEYQQLKGFIASVNSMVEAAMFLRPVAERHRGTQSASATAFVPLNFEKMVDAAISARDTRGPSDTSRELTLQFTHKEHEQSMKDHYTPPLEKELDQLEKTLETEKAKGTMSEDDEFKLRAKVESIHEDIQKLNTGNIEKGIKLASNIHASTFVVIAKHIHPESQDLTIIRESMEHLCGLLKPHDGSVKTMRLEVSQVPTAVQHLVLVGLRLLEAAAGRDDILTGGLNEVAKLALDLEAETTLILSRKQKTFAAIPPAAFGASSAFVPQTETFVKMSQSFLASATSKLLDADRTDERDDDSLTAERVKFLAEKYNAMGGQETQTQPQTQPQTPPTAAKPALVAGMDKYLTNPADAFSERALPHFDCAVKYAGQLSPDNVRRLSAIYQGMGVMPASGRPGQWDTDLSGNRCGFTLPRFESSSFNSALDSLIANPRHTASVVARELVNYASAIVGQRARIASALDARMTKGKDSVVKSSGSVPGGGDPALVRAVNEMAHALSGSRGVDANKVSAAILEGWNTLYTLTWPGQRTSSAPLAEPVTFDHTDDLRVVRDLERDFLKSIPSFERNLKDATRCVYELCAVTCILSEDKEARKAARDVLGQINEKSLFVRDLCMGQVANLVSSLASPSQYRHFLELLANERRRSGATSQINRMDAAFPAIDDPNLYGTVGRVRDGGYDELGLGRFWTNVYDSDYRGVPEPTDMEWEDSDPESGRRFRSVVNTYASLASGRTRTQSRHKEAVDKIAGHVKGLVSNTDTTLEQLFEAQRCYSRLSTAMTSAAFGFTDGYDRKPRRESDCILSASLRELAPKVHGGDASAGRAVATMSHVLAGKVVLSSISAQSPFAAAYRSFLGAAGVMAHADQVASSIFHRLKPSDLVLFLGGSLLQRGLFVSFFLSSVLFGRIDPQEEVKKLSPKARSQLFKLLGFCGALRNLFNYRAALGASETDDASVASALTRVYSTLRTLREKPGKRLLRDIRLMLASASSVPVKKRSTLADVLDAGSSVRKAWLVNYAERASRSNLCRDVMRRNSKNKLADGEATLLDCINDKLRRVRREGERDAGWGHGLDCEDMLLSSDEDECDDDEDDASMHSDSDEDDDDECPWSDDDDDYENDPLRHMGGYVRPQIEGEEEEDEYEDDEEYEEDNYEGIRQRRAEKVVYGPGFLTSSLESAKGGLLQLLSDDDDDDDDDYDDYGVAGGSSRSKLKEEIAALQRQFAPKDVTVVNGRVTSVRLTDRSKLVALLEEYGSARKGSERKKMRTAAEISETEETELPNSYMRRRVEKPNELRKALVENAASAFRELLANLERIRNALFPTPPADTFLSNSVLFGDQLAAVVKKRNELVGDVSATSPTLFGPLSLEPSGLSGGDGSAPPGLPTVSVDAARAAMRPEGGAGYLYVPLWNVGGTLVDTENNADFDSLKKEDRFLTEDTLYGKRLSHLDWLTVSALSLARSYTVATGFALDQLVRSRTALHEMRKAVETLVSLPEDAVVDVRSTLIDDVFNTRMAHVDAVLGLTSPVVFLNRPLTRDRDRFTLEAQSLMVFRGVNSGQLLREKGVTDTATLLRFVSSAGRAGPRANYMSLYKMSVTENLSHPLGGPRITGAVSLEVADGASESCTDHVFSRRPPGFKDYCLEVGFSPAKAVGPIHRFLPTGTVDAVACVAADAAYHRLVEAESDPGAAIAMSAVGNLYGMVDTISRLSARCAEAIDTADVTQTTELDVVVKKLRARTKEQLKLQGGSVTRAPTNRVPVFSDTILADAVAVRSSIAAILSDVGALFETHGGAQSRVKVTMRKFGQMVENVTALGHRRAHLCGLSNRLALYQHELEKVEKMHDMGLSEAIGSFVAIATTMGPYEAQEKKNNAETWLKNSKLVKALVGRELYNIRSARSIVDRCTSSMEIAASRLERMIKSCSGDADGDALRPSKCGGYVTHRDTLMLLCLDEREAGEQGSGTGSDALRKRLAENRLAVTKAKLAALRSGRPEIGTVFSVGQADSKALDALVDSLTRSIASLPPPGPPDERAGVRPAAAEEGALLSQAAGSAGVGGNLEEKNLAGGESKYMPYIPVMFENSTEGAVEAKKGGGGEPAAGEELGGWLFKVRESRNLASVLDSHSRHKFGGYNQAAIASMFGSTGQGGASAAEVIFSGLGGSERGGEQRASGASEPRHPSGGVHTAAPPAATAPVTFESAVESLVKLLDQNGHLHAFEEYEQLRRVHEHVTRALKSQGDVLAIVAGGDLVVGGASPVLNQEARTHLADMLAARADAEGGLRKLIRTLSENNQSKDEESVIRVHSSKLSPADPETARLLQSSRVRAPLLLAHSGFSFDLRTVIDVLGKYYKGLEDLSEAVNAAIERAGEAAEAEAKRSIDLDSSNILPAFADAKSLLERELDAVQSARAEAGTAITEFNGVANTVRDSIDDTNDRIGTGSNAFDVAEFLALGPKYAGELAVKRQMKDLAARHSGAAFRVDEVASSSSSSSSSSPPPSAGGETGGEGTGATLLANTVETVRKGQDQLAVDFQPAIDAYPDDADPGASSEKYTLADHRVREEARLESLTEFVKLLSARSSLLTARIENISREMESLQERRKSCNNIYAKQFESRRKDLGDKMGVIKQTVKTHVGTERAQAATLVDLGRAVDGLLASVEPAALAGAAATGAAATAVAATAAPASTPSGSAAVGTGNDAAAPDDADLHPNATVAPFRCFLEPLHAVYTGHLREGGSKNRPIRVEEMGEAICFDDLVCRNASALKKYGIRNPQENASKIVPGICEMCAMMVFNLHTGVHVSDHKFKFDGVASRKRTRELLEAALKCSVDDSDTVQERLLSLMEGNNGSVKELSFTLKQRVACYTPVNAEKQDWVVWPSTVMLPTSELFDCPSIAHDKFRSMATRAWDPTLASAPKMAGKILETVAMTAGTAESLYYPCKDERRFFNSVCDGVLESMGPKASYVFNTTCDQALARRDANTGLPVFVGRRHALTRPPSSEEERPATLPCEAPSRFDMGASFVVAPGANLNRNKDERLRMSHLDDLNNVRHLNADVHLAASSLVNRIREVLDSAVGHDNCMSRDAARSLLLGSVASLVAEKASSSAGDPYTLIESYREARTITDRAVGSSNTWWGNEITEELLGAQLAYRFRMFPSCRPDSAATIDAGDVLDRYLRYRRARQSLAAGGSDGEACSLLADRFEENPHLLREVRGLLSDSMRARAGADAQRLDDALASARDRMLSRWDAVGRPSVGSLAYSLAGASARDRSHAAANLAVDVMTDSVVDTLSALSAAAGGQGAVPIGNGPASDKKELESLKAEVERVAASVNSPGFRVPGGASAFSAMLSTDAAAAAAAATATAGGANRSEAGSARGDATSATRSVFDYMNSILETNASRLNTVLARGRRKLDRARQLSDAVSSMALELNEEAAAADVHSVRDELDGHLLRESLASIKRAAGATVAGWRSSSPLSSLLSREEVAGGRLYPSAVDRGHRIASAVDEFNTAALLSRYVALDKEWSPLPMSKETRRLLRQPKTETARALLSERSDLLTELVMYNTRDAPVERAVDRVLLLPYLVQEAKRFDRVDLTFPLALTGSSHCMLSAMDVHAYPHSTLAQLKLHLTDTTCFFKNIERFEKLTGRHGDSYAMTHHQNCNCPFQLHHDFRSSVDESLVPSFAYARPEVTRPEASKRPYQVQRYLNDKHYVMAVSKVDPTVTGATILRRVSEWSEMGAGSRYVGTFEPSRDTLSKSHFKTAGVNLDVIVRPGNAKGVMGILGCNRPHICGTTAKLCATTSMPSAFVSRAKGHASDMLQMALPHNVYVQKSKMNASAVVFAGRLMYLMADLLRKILSELAEGLLVGKMSVAGTASASAAAALASLADLGTVPSPVPPPRSSSSPGDDGAKRRVRLMDQAMREMACRTIRRQLTAEPSNVPFADESASTLGLDFLTDDGTTLEQKVRRAATAEVDGMRVDDVEQKALLNQLSVIFTAISQEVDNAQFVAILDKLEARAAAAAAGDDGTKRERAAAGRGSFAEALNLEFAKVLAFMRVLKTNVVPLLTTGGLAKKVKRLFSLISGASRLENFLRFSLSNSGSTDLSHLQHLTKSVRVEDTLVYSKLHPLIVMALPKNCAALLQQEQTDPSLAIALRRPLATFLNHPNTKHMARSARAAVGAGGGHALGLYPSSLALHEMTITTTDPAVQADSGRGFRAPYTLDPLVVIDPFVGGGLLQTAGAGPDTTRVPVSYVQTSMPTQFSGLVTNTGAVLHDRGTAVFCSDAVTNVLDVLSRADASLDNISVRFGFMPELIAAVAAVQNKTERAVVDAMVAAAASTPGTAMEPATGDILLSGGVFPTPETVGPGKVVRQAAAATTTTTTTGTELAWGVGGRMQARLFPRVFLDNPLAVASVNGVPLTEQGRRLSSRKGSAPVFEGLLPTGGLVYTEQKPARLTSRQLEPMRLCYNELADLRDSIAERGVALRETIRKMPGGMSDAQAKEVDSAVARLYAQHQTLAKAQEVVIRETANTVAVNNMLLGGWGGDPTTALISPFNSFDLGIVGMVSSNVRDAFVDSHIQGTSVLNDAFRGKVLSSYGGRVMAEHGLIYGLGEELVEDSILKKKKQSIANILPQPTSKIVANAIAGTGSKMKRDAVECVLLSNEDVLKTVLDVMNETIKV